MDFIQSPAQECLGRNYKADKSKERPRGQTVVIVIGMCVPVYGAIWVISWIHKFW